MFKLPAINQENFTFRINLVKVFKTAVIIYAVISVIYTTYALVSFTKTHEFSVSEKLVSPLASY